MHIVVYADESGTHDKTGVLAGSREATICGIASLREDWTAFCKEWQKVLNNYGVPYFHFREWSAASLISRKRRTPSCDFQKNPYREWNTERLDAFILELATIAGSGHKLVLGGAVHTSRFHKAKMAGEIQATANPYEMCVTLFFSSFIDMVTLQRRPWSRQPVSFVFDWSSDARWRDAVTDVYNSYKERHPKFEGIAFQDKKKHLPLQAADMVAYRSRHITENWVDGDESRQWPELDSALFKSTFEYLKHHEHTVLTAWAAGLLEYERK